jgi:hypothetical protein
MNPKKREQNRPSSTQVPFETDPSVKLVTGDGLGARSQQKEVRATISDHDLIDKDSEFRYLSSVVTECLVSHDKCTGSYISSLGAYVLKCRCSCHSGRRVRNPGSVAVL